MKSQCLQSHVDVPKRGPRNRVEPAGLAIIAFDTQADLDKAEAAWLGRAVAGRSAVTSRTGFQPTPRQDSHSAMMPTPQRDS